MPSPTMWRRTHSTSTMSTPNLVLDISSITVQLASKPAAMRNELKASMVALMACHVCSNSEPLEPQGRVSAPQSTLGPGNAGKPLASKSSERLRAGNSANMIRQPSLATVLVRSSGLQITSESV
eukprot:UN2952